MNKYYLGKIVSIHILLLLILCMRKIGLLPPEKDNDKSQIFCGKGEW